MTSVFSTAALSHTRRSDASDRKEENNLDILAKFACGQVSSPRLYRLSSPSYDKKYSQSHDVIFRNKCFLPSVAAKEPESLKFDSESFRYPGSQIIII